MLFYYCYYYEYSLTQYVSASAYPSVFQNICSRVFDMQLHPKVQLNKSNDLLVVHSPDIPLI